MRAMLRQRGQTSAEYVGVILVVAAVIALVGTSSIGEAVTTKVTCAIQGMGGGAGCGGGESGAPPGEEAPAPAETGSDFALANRAAGIPKKPRGYTWHHVEDGETMQLVPTPIHAATGHSGGAELLRRGVAPSQGRR